MSRQRETNPHFHPQDENPNPQPQHESHDPNLHFPLVPHPHDPNLHFPIIPHSRDENRRSRQQGRPNLPVRSRDQNKRSRQQERPTLPMGPRDQNQRSREQERPIFPVGPHDQNQRSRPEERPNLPVGPHDQDQRSKPQERHDHPLPVQTRPHHNLMFPTQRKTNPLTWFLAVFCALFWVIVIFGGLVILIVYLVFRPRSPKFDIPTASLNAAYLDMGYLLNSDITLLANFTNPSKKVKVDFNYMIISLYHEKNLISTRYIEPFSMMNAESMFANIHMVTSQVPLSVAHSQRLRKQLESNRVSFEIKGLFRTRSSLGSFLRYSYWLYSHCTIVVTGPPSGVLVAKKCRTKR